MMIIMTMWMLMWVLCGRYSSLNPMQQVPTLELRDLATGDLIHLTQSLPIIEFLDEVFPHVSRRSHLPAKGLFIRCMRGR
jgi:glutathione S-transferase